MMRSLFSGVAGLKTHQTRMDVIGNNIANVNTTAYKSQSMVFNDLLYQTTQAASGANSVTGRGGINARQIGLGAKIGAIKTAITQQGSAQSTNDPFDIMITGESFFIVNDGSSNFFTRDGSFTVDGAGNLVMTSTGYSVMGWQVDDEGNIVADTVSALRVMDERNLTYPAESTTRAYFSGIVDENDTNVNSEAGRIVTLNFFDRRGYSYTAKFSIHSTDEQGFYTVQLDDILDSTGVSLVKRYNLNNINEIASFGGPIPMDSTEIREILNGYTYTNEQYNKEVALSEVLGIGSAQRILDMAKEWAMVEKTTVDGKEEYTALSKGAKLEKDKSVLIQGTIEVESDTAEKLGTVMWNETKKCYEYKGADGKPVELPGDDTKEWEKALKSLGLAEDSIQSVKVDEVTGHLEIIFRQEFKITQDATVETSRTVSVKIDDPMEAFGLENTGDTTYGIDFITSDGLRAQVSKAVIRQGNRLVFDVGDGEFSYVGSPGNDSVMMTFNDSAASIIGQTIDLSMFTDIDIDFSALSNQDNGGTSTSEATSGALENPALGAGRRIGEMIGISVGQDGVITASYDNGQNKTLGQIAVAVFANASGLSKSGDNIYSATPNSGEFDGVGQDITADGSGYMTSGVLEMSNVDLSQEFTEMITTQRGFQANSRIITVSDTLLEELVNLKR